MQLMRVAILLFAVAPIGMGIGPFCGSSEPEGPELPESTPFTPELQERLHAIRDGVAEIRDLPVNADVVEGTLTRDQLRAYYAEIDASVTDEDRSEIEATNTAMRLLRMIGPEDDVFDAYSEGESEGILGFYVAEDDELVFIGDPALLTPEDEFVLAHEYVHSFVYGSKDEESILDLIEDEAEDFDARTEYTITAQCLEEGDASLAGFLFAQQEHGDGFFDDSGEEEPPAADPEINIPPAIERYQAFNYNECITFAAALYYDEGGDWSAIDDAYDEPPSTTEQILHPEKYRSREGTTGMSRVDFSERLGDGWELWWAGIFGEFDVYNYLVTILDDELGASIAADGWGVGWLSIYTTEPTAKDPADVIVHVALEFDTEDDFAQFGRAYGDVLDIIAPGVLRYDATLRPVCWDLPGEYGYAMFGDGQSRWDIVIATTAEARDAATSGPLSMRETPPCV
jgi:hypothetical protein